MSRIVVLLIGLVVMAGCSAATSQEPLAELGEFRLEHNVVIASKAKKVPVSRDATEQEWVDVLTTAVAERFGQYQGSQRYHFGISVEGYALAPKGVPVVFSPKSVLAINVTVWDDAAGKKLNEEVEQFTVFETTTGGSFLVGSGHTRSKEQQMLGLSRNAVRQIEQWMIKQHETDDWFAQKPGAIAEDIAEQSPVTPDDD